MRRMTKRKRNSKLLRGKQPQRMAMWYGAFWSDGLSTVSALSIVTRNKAIAVCLAKSRKGIVTKARVKGSVGIEVMRNGEVIEDYRIQDTIEKDGLTLCAECHGLPHVGACVEVWAANAAREVR